MNERLEEVHSIVYGGGPISTCAVCGGKFGDLIHDIPLANVMRKILPTLGERDKLIILAALGKVFMQQKEARLQLSERVDK